MSRQRSPYETDYRADWEANRSKRGASNRGENHAKEPNDFNLFNTRGELDVLAYMCVFIALCAAMALFYPFINNKVRLAREAMRATDLVRLYMAWFAVCCTFAIMHGNALMKRWSNALPGEALPFWLRCLVRLSLLSPLLSIWMPLAAMLVPLAFPKSGKEAEWVPTFSRVGGSLLISGLLFHAAYLGWGVKTKQILFNESYYFESTRVKSSDEVVAQANVVPEAAFAFQTYHVHVRPYLTPGLKFGYFFQRDFLAAQGLIDEISFRESAVCKNSNNGDTIFAGVTVRDCFQRNYQEAIKGYTILSPLPAIWGELRYRELLAKHSRGLQNQGISDGASPLRPLAEGVLVFKNVAAIMDLTGDMEEATLRPVGFLVQSGSPEVPLLSALPLLHRYFLSTKFLPKVLPQFNDLVTQYGGIRQTLQSDQAYAIDIELQKVREKFDSLAASPFLAPKDPVYK